MNTPPHLCFDKVSHLISFENKILHLTFFKAKFCGNHTKDVLMS